MRKIILVATMMAIVAACGRDGERGAGSGSAAQALPIARDTTCPLVGNWLPCSVTIRLERAGLAPRLLPDTLQDPAFGVPGLRYVVGDATLDVFLYATPEARESATAALDSAALVRTRARPVSEPGGRLRPAHFMQSANMAAILANASELQAERVFLAITAGQPAR